MNNFMENLFKFLEAEQEAEEKGEKEFICPLCGGKAWWMRSSYNGHKHSGCANCGFRIDE